MSQSTLTINKLSKPGIAERDQVSTGLLMLQLKVTMNREHEWTCVNLHMRHARIRIGLTTHVARPIHMRSLAIKYVSD